MLTTYSTVAKNTAKIAVSEFTGTCMPAEKGTATGRYKSPTGSTQTASPGRINSDRLGS